MFMWTDQWSQALSALSLLRTMDPTFRTKVRMSGIDYDAEAEPVAREAAAVQTGRLADYVAVTCLTWDELFGRKVALFARFYAEYHRVPKLNELFEDKKIGSMLSKFRSQRETMKPDLRLALDEAMPGWSVMNEAIMVGHAAALSEAEKLALLARFYALNHRVPKNAEMFEERNIGKMLTSFRTQRETMKHERRAALDEAMPGWSVMNEALVAAQSAKLSDAEKVALFSRFYAAHHRVPKWDENFEERKIGSMLSHFRRVCETMKPDRRAALDEAMPGWSAVNEARMAALAGSLTRPAEV